jgi:membrane-bound ClpP family serine protease
VSIQGNAGGEAAARDILAFIRYKLAKKLGREPTAAEKEVLSLVECHAEEIIAECISGWY